MTTLPAFPVPATDGAHIVALPGGLVGVHYLLLAFDSAPSAGTATVEKRAIGSAEWELLPEAEDIDVTSGMVAFGADGPVGAFRVTFAGLVGGGAAQLRVSSEPAAAPPFVLMTDHAVGPAARLRVDPGQTGFFARRMWRISYEFTALGATPIVVRVIVPVNFILHYQGLSVDTGGVAMRAYRSTQGVAGGTFDTPIPMRSVNFMDELAEYAFLATVATGGTFTPSEAAVETIRVRSANATAQQTTVGGESFGERGLAAGTYYLILSQLTGVSGDSTGVFSLVIEERP